MNATYSPDDNKLRLYSTTRLDAATYERVKDAGFRWAPKQGLFFAVWTPRGEDLLIELCGEIDDEDTSLVERAEVRADRFEGYSANRAREATQARDSVQAIGQRFEFGQPILVGHHSERKARKDAERMESGMRKAVKAWETSGYWQDRAQGALAHAKYLERPDVRARRIKTIEADKRKQERSKDEAEKWLKAWSKDGLTHEEAVNIANYCHLHMPRIEGDKPDFNQSPSAYCVLTNAYPTLYAPRTLEQVVERAKKTYPKHIAWAERWIAHYDNRLTYERAMLGQSGGIVAELVNGALAVEVGGRVLIDSAWYTVLRVNKKDGRTVSVRTNMRYVPVRGLEEIKQYEPPTAEQAQQVKDATKVGPTCNYPGDGHVHITAEQWEKVPKDYRALRKVGAGEKAGPYRVRVACGVWLPVDQKDANVRHKFHCVFITDAKRVDPPAPATDAPRVPEPEQVLRAPRPAADPVSDEKALLDMEMKAVKDQLKRGGVVVQTVNAPQLFPTPLDLARRMVELADLKAGELVLEPSAGTGRIVQAVVDMVDTEIVGYEINPDLCRFLSGKFPSYRLQVRCRDFLDVTDGMGGFDVVLMNPPFAKAADVAHIRHAVKFLRPGGRLVAICAGGPRQSEALRPLVDSLGGTWEPLPAGTFKEEGTGVNSVLLSLTAPAAPEAAQVAELEEQAPLF